MPAQNYCAGLPFFPGFLGRFNPGQLFELKIIDNPENLIGN
jgi:hypothetical protein